MVSEADLPLTNAYTDSPKLHSNLILGSLQLLFWLFFHPSAWRHHIVTIDPNLRSNFVLSEVTPAQWRNPQLRRLLVRGYLILPALAGLITGFMGWIVGETGENIMLGMLFGLIFGVGISLGSNLILGTAVSLALVMAVGIIGGLMTGGLAASGAKSLSTSPPDALAFGIVFGLMSGAAGGVVGGVTSTISDQAEIYPLIRRGTTVIIGIALASLMLFFGGSLVSAGTNFITLSIVVGLIVSIAVGWRRGPVVGGGIGLVGSLALGLAFSLNEEVAARVILFMALVLPTYLLARAAAGPWIGVSASTLGAGIGWVLATTLEYAIPIWPIIFFHLLSIIFGLALPLWRPLLLYPFFTAWNLLLYRQDAWRKPGQISLLRWHSAFWDEHQRVPLFRLKEHLLLVMKRNPVEAQAAIDYLATSRQRWAAQAAQIELDARNLESCLDAEAIAQAHRNLGAGELTGPASALLRSFSRISQDTKAALAQTNAYNQRLALSAVEDRLDGLLRELTRSSERYAIRFRPIATGWRQILADEGRELAETVESRQEIESPYVIGIPLTEQQEIFVGRTDISARIEQLLLDRRRPPLLLYGQRRMGKTSLLYNLSRLLPSTVVPLFVDLQGPASQAQDYAGFFYNIARAMRNSAQRQRNLELPDLTRKILSVDPFTYFDEWLDGVEHALGECTALVTLDEFEALEGAINKGRLDGQDLLSMLRHLIQHRPRFKILLTSSQTLEAFRHWSSYLINIQVVHISYLSQIEAYQLIEQPVKDFALHYEPNASQRIFELTRGHPFLIQLLCDEIIALKNDQTAKTRRLACLADVEQAIPETLARGSFFFADIERNQIDRDELAILKFLAQRGEGGLLKPKALVHQVEQPNKLNRSLSHLLDRELIEAVNGEYRFQVELIRRWFAKKNN